MSLVSQKIQDIQNLAKQRAIELAIKELQTSDSLNNVQDLRDTILKQNEMVRNKLRAVTNTQVEESEVAMKSLSNSYETHQLIQNYFKMINTKAKQAQDLYDNYAIIRKCVITSRNVRRAMEGLDRILKLQAEIKYIEDMIEKDYTQVYEAYERVIKLEEVRDAALLESVGEHSFFLEVFKDYFRNINQCSEKFNELIFKQILEYDGITTLGQESPQLLVQIARVIEEEESRDIKRMEEMEKRNQVQKKGEEQSQVQLKRFKQRLFDVIDNDIKVKLQLKITPKDVGKGAEKIPPPPIPIVLESFSKLMVQQFDYAQIDVEPCFPDSYKILDFYINSFNKHMGDYVDGLLKNRENLDYSDTLALAYWMRIDYPVSIEEFLTGDAQPLEYKKEAQLLLDEFIIHKNKSMIDGVRIAVEQDFAEDMKPLPKPGTGYPYTPSCVEVFTMLNSQLDQVKESKNSNRADFVVNMVKTNTIILITYASNMSDGIRKRIRSINPLWVMSYANNVTLCRTLLDQYMKRLLEFLHADFHESISMALNPGYEAFTELLNVCVDSVIEILMEEMDYSFNQLFTDAWENRDTNPLYDIMDCVEKFRKHNFVEKDYAGILYERLLTKLIQKYLDILILGKRVVKDVYGEDDTIESKFEDDMTEFEQCFSQFLPKDQIQEIMFPLMNLKFYVKDVTKCKDDLDKFIFALNELLREYPQIWDVALAIVNQSTFIGGDMKKKMKECIEASFYKEVQSGTEPTSRKSAFSKYIRDYSIAAKREQEKKMKALNQQFTQQIVIPKKEPSKLVEVKKEPPKEAKKEADVASLEDLLGESLDI